MIKINYKKGFTLLEALVAISILMVAVAAPITIAQKGLSSATYSKNQMIASYLAQDVIEYIKNKRDEVSISNLANYSDWDNLNIFGIDSPTPANSTLCMSPNGCEIDTLKPIGTAVTQVTTLRLLNTNTDGFYGYDTTGNPTQTNFTRRVKIELHNVDASNPSVKDEALITVTVSWGSDSVVVKSLIYNI